MAAENPAQGPCDIRVTLLGTGVPTPVMERFGPSTLVEAGGETLLFDAGRGVLQRLFQLQTKPAHRILYTSGSLSRLD